MMPQKAGLFSCPRKKSPPKRVYADSGVRKPNANLRFLLAMPPWRT